MKRIAVFLALVIFLGCASCGRAEPTEKGGKSMEATIYRDIVDQNNC